MNGPAIDLSTMAPPTTTLIRSAELTEEQKQRVRDNVGDFARFLQDREGLSNEQRNEAADELLQMLGLADTPAAEFLK